MSINDGLTKQQIEELSSVFRAEAVEHIKSIAQILFAIEDGSDSDLDDSINRAFRDAHSLKGSAGTLGFGRIAIIAHKFEDAMGTVRDKKNSLTPQNTNILLQTLEVIRQAILNSAPGDDELSDREHAILNNISKEFNLETLDENTTPNKSKSKNDNQTQQPERPEQPEQPAKTKQTTQTTEHHTDLVRVSERHIDDVISQFGSLFEASLQVESLGSDLQVNNQEAERMSAGLTSLLEKFSGSKFESEVMELLDVAKNLSIISKSITTKFQLNQRELAKHINRSQTVLRELRIAPISTLEFTIKNQVREAAEKTGKSVSVALSGGQHTVDRAILNAIEKPLIHLIRNSIDHGIEFPKDRIASGKPAKGLMTIEAQHMGDAVELIIKDDGQGIDPEKIKKALIANYNIPEDQVNGFTRQQLLDYLFEPGFSTSTKVSQISGRGVGLDVVKYTIEHLGGEVTLTSQKGEGTTISLRLPLTMSSVKCLLFEAANQIMAIPASNVSKVIGLSADNLKIVGGGRVIEKDNEQIPITTFEKALGMTDDTSGTDNKDIKFVAIVKFGDRKYAFGFDIILEYTQLIVKPLGDLLERVPNISGLALLGTGNLCMVLNPGDLIRSVTGASSIVKTTMHTNTQQKVITILVVDDSIAIRTMQQTLLESSGFKVLTAIDGLKALQILSNNHVDLVLSDVQMPNMDGFELTRTIKTRDKLKNIPVVLITSLGSPEDIDAGLQAGADAHIIKKELTRTELINTINQLL